MTKILRQLLFAATAFASVPAAAQTAKSAPPAAPAPAALPDVDPALWVVRDADTTIYLFGTFHALDGKTAWFNDEVKAAFDRSSKVYFEIVQPENPAAIAPLMQRYAMATDGKTLTSRLSEKGRKDLATTLASLGMPATALDGFKPFFASIVLAMQGAQKVGKTGANGAEAVIAAAAKKAGKPVDQLETIEFQMSMFDALPEAEQIRLLEHTVATFGEMESIFARMTKAWNSGDPEGFAALMNEMQSQSPRLFEVMLSQRNANWADWIENRLKSPGTIFLAVGAGHLAGKDSVQDLLAKDGIKTTRIAY